MLDVCKLTNENVISLFAIIVTSIGVIIALRQWIQHVKIQRSEFVKQLIDKLRFDESVSEAAYIIDYDLDWYNSTFHNNSNRVLESKIDKYLAYLSYLCYLIETKSITKKEVQLFEYKLFRTVQSPSVQAYLWNLTHFSQKFGIKCSCYKLVEYGIKRKIIKNDFLPIDCGRFQKTLIF